MKKEKVEQLSFLTDSLYKKDDGEYLDGKVSVVRFLKSGAIVENACTAEDLKKLLLSYVGEENIFYGVSTTYNGKRGINNIRHLVSLYVDIDIKNKKRKSKKTIQEERDQFYLKLMSHYEEGLIPKPTFVINSGAGLHVYWAINDKPVQSLWVWQRVEDYLCYSLKNVGMNVDFKSKDAARILRQPLTINNGNICEIIDRSGIKYDLYELERKYLPPRKKDVEKEKKKFGIIEGGAKRRIPTKENPIPLSECRINVKRSTDLCYKSFNSYTLHSARLHDLLKLCEIRNYKMTGYRNITMTLFIYWTGIIIRDKDDLTESALKLNGRFSKPLPKKSINDIVKSCYKQVERFINYSMDLNAGKARRVSKGMRDKPGYWYKNETLVNILDITEEEQKFMKTIISKETKYSRRREEDNRKNKERQKAKYRNEEGLTKTEVKRRNEFIIIARLQLSGESLRSIAKRINSDASLLSKKMRKKYKIINYQEIYNEVSKGLYDDLVIAM